jgi:curved DNA-binding protein CbpA
MDPWQLLGIDSASTYEEANSAYRIRLQLRHPDRHQGSSKAVLDEAERETRELNEAWDSVKVQIRLRDEPRHVSQSPVHPSHGVDETNVEDRGASAEHVAQESVRVARDAPSSPETLAAHQRSLEVARLQLAFNKAYLDRALSEGGSIRISRLREAIAFSEKMVIAAESAVRCNEYPA